METHKNFFSSCMLSLHPQNISAVKDFTGLSSFSGFETDRTNESPIKSLLVIMLPVAFADTLALDYDGNGDLISGDGYYRVYNSLNQLSKVYNGSDASSLLMEELFYHLTFQQ
jgi:hypothetical protein